MYLFKISENTNFATSSRWWLWHIVDKNGSVDQATFHAPHFLTEIVKVLRTSSVYMNIE